MNSVISLCQNFLRSVLLEDDITKSRLARNNALTGKKGKNIREYTRTHAPRRTIVCCYLGSLKWTAEIPPPPLISQKCQRDICRGASILTAEWIPRTASQPDPFSASRRCLLLPSGRPRSRKKGNKIVQDEAGNGGESVLRHYRRSTWSVQWPRRGGQGRLTLKRPSSGVELR